MCTMQTAHVVALELPLARRREPEPRGYVAAPELPQPKGRSRCLDLMLVRGGYPILRVPTVAPGPTPGEAANPRVGSTSFPREAFLSLYTLEFRSGGAARLIRGDPRFMRTLQRSRNHHAPQFHVGRYCSAGITGPEAIMTTILELMGHHAYGMRRDSVSAQLHHHFAVQCGVMSGT
jgi:hypothetical protein